MRPTLTATAALLLLLSTAISPRVGFADADILPADSPRDISVLYHLGIARGHLLASMQLARTGRLDQSVLHSRHALDESCAELAKLLTLDEFQSLRPKIETMNEAIALKLPLRTILAAHEEIDLSLGRLAAATYFTGDARTRQTLDLVLLLLKQALAEYEEAWDNLQLKDRAEYQDGFGFVAVATSELQAILPALRARNPEIAAEIDKTVARLTDAWPSPEPPERPVLSKPLLRALVTAVEINTRQLTR
jgi:hypothetical protein